MKAIQITFDERLLEKLDNDEEVKQGGRSAVIRRAVADYLRKKRRATVAAAYRRAYGRQPAESDLSGWADEGVWPSPIASKLSWGPSSMNMTPRGGASPT